jgi:hypothetical protein
MRHFDLRRLAPIVQTSSLHSRSVAPLHALLCVMAVFLAAVAGCRSDPPPPPPTTSPPNQQPPNWPEKLSDFRFRWSAEPGFDLVTGWAVPLRAYLESWLVVLYTANLDAGYPGYQRATPELLKRGSAEWANTPWAQRQIRAFSGSTDFDDPSRRIVGNEELHVLQAEPLDTGFRAFVCDATYDVYEELAAATQFAPLNLDISNDTNKPDFHNMHVWRIEFSDRDPRMGPAPPASPTAPQRGPLPAPETDVFGPWFVTGAQHVRFWWNNDYPGLTPGSPEDNQRTREARTAEDEMRQQCLDRYPLDAAQRATRATTVIDTAPPVEPALPGWPE